MEYRGAFFENTGNGTVYNKDLSMALSKLQANPVSTQFKQNGNFLRNSQFSYIPGKKPLVVKKDFYMHQTMMYDHI